jgi:hypothetical protein
MENEKSNEFIWNRTGGLPVYSIVPQLTTLPPAINKGSTRCISKKKLNFHEMRHDRSFHKVSQPF